MKKTTRYCLETGKTSSAKPAAVSPEEWSEDREETAQGMEDKVERRNRRGRRRRSGWSRGEEIDSGGSGTSRGRKGMCEDSVEV
jgi:hypothetical protein